MAALRGARCIVIKIGSALLIDRESGALREEWLGSLCTDIAALRASGSDVVIVSSGSIALGRGVLGLTGSLTLEQSQAAAAVGQIQLAQAYQSALSPHGMTAGQVLLTLDDSENRRRYLNTRATMGTLLSLGVVPIVNENDTIATDEIRFGDNDRLAAQVAVTIGADRLVLLSDVDGLYTANPAETAEARRLSRVPRITPEIEAMAGDAGSGLSKGGMKTKIMAAKVATQAGCAMVIALGSRHNPLLKIDEGVPTTWFEASGDPQAARKRWIASMKPRGEVTVDAGAVRALSQGKSLLPAGVTAVEGSFERGDPVSMRGDSGETLGIGLSRYTCDEAQAIRGRHTEDFEAILGYQGRAALIHRDDMVMT
ncbi:MAG: glutamate 5-kinase [Pseudomonadota bacterium]